MSLGRHSIAILYSSIASLYLFSFCNTGIRLLTVDTTGQQDYCRHRGGRDRLVEIGVEERDVRDL